MPELADRARQAGATFIIAHPMSVGDPYCTGCDWGYPDMMPGNGRIVEVWNSEWGSDRQKRTLAAIVVSLAQSGLSDGWHARQRHSPPDQRSQRRI